MPKRLSREHGQKPPRPEEAPLRNEKSATLMGIRSVDGKSAAEFRTGGTTITVNEGDELAVGQSRVKVSRILDREVEIITPDGERRLIGLGKDI